MPAGKGVDVLEGEEDVVGGCAGGVGRVVSDCGDYEVEEGEEGLGEGWGEEGGGGG